MNRILAVMSTNVNELKRNYAAILKQADDGPVAVMNHNRAEAYLLPAAYYEQLIDYLEELEDAKLVRERSEGPFVEVSLDEL